jgi:outer membrane murein-binding lipoprotein Lpp
LKLRSALVSSVVVGALALAGCSSGPTIAPITIGKSDQLCTDTSTFQAQAAALEAASTTGDLTSLQKEAKATHDALAQLQTDAAKLVDKVNGHLVKDDLATAAATYAALTDALNAANPSDPNALSKALASVQAKEGQTFTQATTRLDAYTKKVCGLTTATTTTGGPTTTSTVVPVGPTGSPTTTTASTVAGSTTVPSTTVPSTTVSTTSPTTTGP